MVKYFIDVFKRNYTTNLRRMARDKNEIGQEIPLNWDNGES